MWATAIFFNSKGSGSVIIFNGTVSKLEVVSLNVSERYSKVFLTPYNLWEPASDISGPLLAES